MKGQERKLMSEGRWVGTKGSTGRKGGRAGEEPAVMVFRVSLNCETVVGESLFQGHKH